MDELLKKFPELLKALLDKLSESDISANIPEMKEAKDRLFSQLQTITNEITELQNQPGEKLTEEQCKVLMEKLPLPPSMQWTIKPRGD